MKYQNVLRADFASQMGLACQLHLWKAVIGVKGVPKHFVFPRSTCRLWVSLKGWISVMKSCRQLDSLIAGWEREKTSWCLYKAEAVGLASTLVQ